MQHVSYALLPGSAPQLIMDLQFEAQGFGSQIEQITSTKVSLICLRRGTQRHEIA